VTDSVDVVAVVAELRAEVERRRAAGQYDEQVLRALHEEFGADLNESPEAVAYLASSRPLGSDRALLGRITVFTKRVIRRLLGWYVAPIAEDQTRFNIAAIRLMRRLEQRLVSIEHTLDLDNQAAQPGDSPREGAWLPTVTELSSRVDRLEQTMDELAQELKRSDRA
jgi:hypothetical protein